MRPYKTDVGGRDPMFEAQQEILRKRRSGVNVESEVSARRTKVSGFLRKTLPKEEMAAIKKKNKDQADELSKVGPGRYCPPGGSTRPLFSSTCVFFVTETTQSTQVSHRNCSRQAEKWTSVSPWRHHIIDTQFAPSFLGLNGNL